MGGASSEVQIVPKRRVFTKKDQLIPFQFSRFASDLLPPLPKSPVSSLICYLHIGSIVIGFLLEDGGERKNNSFPFKLFEAGGYFFHCKKKKEDIGIYHTCVKVKLA